MEPLRDDLLDEIKELGPDPERVLAKLEVSAGEKGATFLDFGIHFPDPGDGPKAQSSMEFDEKPRDPERRIFNARWIGNPYAKK